MLDKIIPPDDPKKVTNWRWFLTIAIGIVLLDSVAGRAGISFLGISSYASASELQEQSAKIDAVDRKIDRSIALQISGILRGLNIEKCRANGNKQTFELTIESYQQDYIDLTGKRYPLPPCYDESED